MHRLVTIRFSHFNEKARWALDRFGVPYHEEAYMPGIHAIGALRIAPRHGVGKSDRISTPLGTPILITDDGRCIRDSSRIVRYVSDRYAKPEQSLYPDPEVEALEERFSNRLGPHTRRYAYFQAFQMPGVLDTIADENVGPRQARWFKRIYPLIERVIARRLRVTPEHAERSLGAIREDMDEVSRRIEGRRYLVGERFTAADLAFACMASPALLPEVGYGAVMPRLETLPAALQDLIREMRSTPAGEYVLRMFREERGERKVPFTA
jgi:glutathione S-transferase